MDRISAWIVERLRWLLPVAVLVGAVSVYLGWTDASDIREVSVGLFCGGAVGSPVMFVLPQRRRVVA